MRLVSLNAWGGQVWSALEAWLPGLGADILCLQEVIRAPVPSPDWLRYVDRYRRLDQRADLFGDVCRLLPGHQARFAAVARGGLADAAGRHYPSEHGIGTWVARDLAVSGSFQGFVHGSYRHRGWGAEPVPRAIQIQRIADPASGGSLLYGHFHGLRDPAGKHDTPARAAQTRAVVAALSAMMRPGEPVVLAGDFNLLPDSRFFDAMREIGLSDLVTGRGHDDTRTSLYRKEQRHADYLLVSAEVRVEAFDVPARPEVSDHRPLILDFDP